MREAQRRREAEKAKAKEELHFHIGWPGDELEFIRKAGPLNLQHASDGTWHVTPMDAHFRLPTFVGTQDVFVYQQAGNGNAARGDANVTLGASSVHFRSRDTNGGLLISIHPRVADDERWFETNIGFGLWKKKDPMLPASFGDLKRVRLHGLVVPPKALLLVNAALFSKVTQDTGGRVLLGEGEHLIIGGKQAVHHSCGLYVSHGELAPMPHDLWKACDVYLIDLGSEALTITITTTNPDRTTLQNKQFTPKLIRPFEDFNPARSEEKNSPLAKRAADHHEAVSKMIRNMRF